MEYTELFPRCYSLVLANVMNETVPLQHKLPLHIGQKMFDEVMAKCPNELPVSLDLSMFSIQKARLNKTQMRENMVSQLAECLLKELLIDVAGLKKYTNNGDVRFCNIATLLRDCTNPESRKVLKHLTINGSVGFPDAWLDKILKLFPNLTSLVRKGNINFAFPHLSRTFEQVRSLDLSHSLMQNLNGISKMPNIEVLCLRNMSFARYTDIMDIFQLRHLRSLDVSRSHGLAFDNIMYILVLSGQWLPVLTFLDCTLTDMDEFLFQDLWRLSPAINTLCIHRTEIEGAEFFPAHMQVLRSINLPSALELLAHFVRIDRASMVESVLQDIRMFLDQRLDYAPNQELLHNCFNQLMNILENATLNPSVDKNKIAYACISLGIYCDIYSPLMPPQQITRIIETLSSKPWYNETWFWVVLCYEEILNVDGFQNRDFYQKSIDFICENIESLPYTAHGIVVMTRLHPRLNQDEKDSIRNLDIALRGLLMVLERACKGWLYAERSNEDHIRFTALAIRQILEGSIGKFDYHYVFNFVHRLMFDNRGIDLVQGCLVVLVQQIQSCVHYKTLRRWSTYFNIRSQLTAACYDIYDEERQAIALMALQTLANSVTPIGFRTLRPRLERFLIQHYRGVEDLAAPAVIYRNGDQQLDLFGFEYAEEWAEDILNNLKYFIDTNHKRITRRLHNNTEGGNMNYMGISLPE